MEIAADGRVLALHRHPPAETHDLGDVALIPGLINAHTHLEFSELAEPLQPSRPFSDWLRALLAYRRSRGDAQAGHPFGARRIAAQRHGRPGRHRYARSAGPIFGGGTTRVTAFRELLGLDPATVALQLGTASGISRPCSRTMRQAGVSFAGFSPHAPYSVHPRLLDGIISLATTRQRPVAIHLAETRAELELLASGTGELVDLLTEAGIWQGALYPSGTRPLDFLRRLEGLPRVVIAHGNYFDRCRTRFLGSPSEPGGRLLPANARVFRTRESSLARAGRSWRSGRDRNGRPMLQSRPEHLARIAIPARTISRIQRG